MVPSSSKNSQRGRGGNWKEKCGHIVFSQQERRRGGENTNYKGARKCLHQPSASSGPPMHMLQWEELEGVGVHVKYVGKPVVLCLWMSASVQIFSKDSFLMNVCSDGRDGAEGGWWWWLGGGACLGRTKRKKRNQVQ